MSVRWCRSPSFYTATPQQLADVLQRSAIKQQVNSKRMAEGVAADSEGCSADVRYQTMNGTVHGLPSDWGQTLVLPEMPAPEVSQHPVFQ